MTASDAGPLLTLLILAATALVLVGMAAVRRHHGASAAVALAGIAAAFIALLVRTPETERVARLVVVDPFGSFFVGLVLLAAGAVTAIGHTYLGRREERREEFYILVVLGTLGACGLVLSAHFATVFLSLELLSLSLYVLIGYDRTERRLEGSLKYLVLASVSSAFLLLGMALVYARTGTMEIAALASAAADDDLVYWTGLAFVGVAFFFKLALAPFHMWAPDVYEGAPAPVTAFVSTASKGAVLALLFRFSAGAGLLESSAFVLAIALVAGASMIAGNVLALLQQNVKRLLAYSSIAHLGYLTVAFLASGTYGPAAAAYYLAAYSLTSLVAFGVVALLPGRDGEAEWIDDYEGLLWRRPALATAFLASLLSLAGIPLTAGFVGKFALVAAAADASLWTLAIILVVTSVVGLYYYLRVIAAMLRRVEGEGAAGGEPRLPLGSALVLGLLAVAIVWLGVLPQGLFELIGATVGG